jgi:1-acyl-sn-glycerol-3-phosphate acyltransferase
MHDSVERVFLQPLTVSYTHRYGMPVTRRERPSIAWYGDMDLAPHLGLFVQGHPLDVVVTWGEPIPFNGNRKEATARAEAEVRRALKAA